MPYFIDSYPLPAESLPPAELSRMAIARIEANPKSWDQSAWHCDTSHCYAGHIDLILCELNAFELPPWADNLNYNVRAVLGLDKDSWLSITATYNTLQEIKDHHVRLFGGTL